MDHEIPIVQKLGGLYKTFYKYLALFPRKDKYAIGNKCETYIMSTLELLLEAGAASKIEKLGLIKRASVKFDVLKIFFRLAYEFKLLDNKKYVELQKSLQEIGRMLGGWQRSLGNL